MSHHGRSDGTYLYHCSIRSQITEENSEPTTLTMRPVEGANNLGIFVLREPVTVRKMIGLVTALAALAALAGS